jgi:hypothetical protein
VKTIIAVIVSIYSSLALSADPFWKQGLTGDSHEIVVYRSETCGCCKDWIAHLREHNFVVNDVRVSSVSPYKQNLNVPQEAASCHTAVVDGLVVEGHVPAQDIKRALSDRGDTRLLTVPAMPSGTPGMDMPGAPKQAFKVYAISDQDEVSVYNSYADY